MMEEPINKIPLDKTCPFCGSDAQLEVSSRLPFRKGSVSLFESQVRCLGDSDSCGLVWQTDLEFEDREESINDTIGRWNARVAASSAASAADIGRLLEIAAAIGFAMGREKALARLDGVARSLHYTVGTGLGYVVKEGNFSFEGEPVGHLLVCPDGRRVGEWWLEHPYNGSTVGPYMYENCLVSREPGAAMRALLALDDLLKNPRALQERDRLAKAALAFIRAYDSDDVNNYDEVAVCIDELRDAIADTVGFKE